MEITTTKRITSDDNLHEVFKDFMCTDALSPLSLEDIKDVFSQEDKIVIYAGEGASLDEAIQKISKDVGWFSPIAARHIALFVSVKSEKISKVISSIDKFKESMKYAKTFKWGFTINQEQNCDYIVHIASAGLVNEDEIIPIELNIMEDCIHLCVMRRYADRVNKASHAINKKYYYYKSRYGESKSDKEVCLITMMDIVMQSMDDKP